MSLIELTSREEQRLWKIAGETSDARVYRRALAILQVAQGQAVEEVAVFLNVHRGNVYRWMETYAQSRDPKALADRPGRGRPAQWGNPEQAALLEALRTPPQDLGYAPTQWTVPLLREHLRRQGLADCSDSTLRRQLHALDWVWKRGRHNLAPDPEREKKTPDPKQAQVSAAAQCRALRG